MLVNKAPEKTLEMLMSKCTNLYYMIGRKVPQPC